SSPSLLEQASAWAVQLAGDEASEADFLALEAWIAQSPEHAKAYTEAEGLLAALAEDPAALDAALKASAPAAQLVSPSPRRRRPSSGARPSRRLWIASAAALAACAVGAVILVPSMIGVTETYVTETGEQRTIALSDGSTIVMNGGSRLSVRLTARERRVEMASAEAAFDVARDARRPFRITVGQSQVQVLGTAFDVRRSAQATRVSVTRGLVEVSDLQDETRRVRLSAGQSVDRADADGRLDVTTASPEAAGWRTGRLIYDDRPLREVIEDLNRAYQKPIATVGPVGDLRFTGVLALDDQAAVVRRLQTFLPVVAVPTDAAIELRPR
ncbi:hypothetical protein LTR94_027636, partial [Friedmanniomyces endolithicus]